MIDCSRTILSGGTGKKLCSFGQCQGQPAKEPAATVAVAPVQKTEGTLSCTRLELIAPVVHQIQR